VLANDGIARRRGSAGRWLNLLDAAHLYLGDVLLRRGFLLTFVWGELRREGFRTNQTTDKDRESAHPTIEALARRHFNDFNGPG
jgi:hypothetical protein